MKANKKKFNIKFQDNKGNTIQLPGSLTIEDLVRMDIKFKIEPKEAPLKDSWYRDIE